MEKNKEVKSTARGEGKRKVYSSPQVVEYGTVNELTQGAVTSGVDLGGGKSV